jgi:hypothetical protein
LAGVVKTPTSPLENAINNVQAGITNIFSGVGNTLLNIVNGPSSPTAETVTAGAGTDTADTEAGGGNFLQNLISNLFNIDQKGTGASHSLIFADPNIASRSTQWFRKVPGTKSISSYRGYVSVDQTPNQYKSVAIL